MWISFEVSSTVRGWHCEEVQSFSCNGWCCCIDWFSDGVIFWWDGENFFTVTSLWSRMLGIKFYLMRGTPALFTTIFVSSRISWHYASSKCGCNCRFLDEYVAMEEHAQSEEGKNKGSKIRITDPWRFSFNVLAFRIVNHLAWTPPYWFQLHVYFGGFCGCLVKASMGWEECARGLHVFVGFVRGGAVVGHILVNSMKCCAVQCIEDGWYSAWNCCLGANNSLKLSVGEETWFGEFLLEQVRSYGVLL